MDKLFEYKFSALGSANQIKLGAIDPAKAQQVITKVVTEVTRIEAKYSRYKEDSILSVINSNAGKQAIQIDQETALLLSYADACFKQSSGLFDITSGVLRRVWNFKQATLPEQKAIEEILPLIGWKKVELTKSTIRLKLPEMQIDFGGIGKEYAVDRAALICLEGGANCGFINFGGDMRVLGPRSDGSGWRIGIQHPRQVNGVIAQIELKEGALATSGDYERFIEVDGKRYCHIMNPTTGWPVQGAQSVSVVADSCLIAGSVSTIAMLRGGDVEFLQSSGVPYLVVGAKGELSGALAKSAPQTRTS
jgi:thiamine biosynthesis lipoprotein